MVLLKSTFSCHLVRYIRFIVAPILFLSCSIKNEDFEPPVDYYPLNAQMARIYEVSETTYSINIDKFEKAYYLKEQLSNIITENNISTFDIVRYKSNSKTTGWKIDSVWTGRKTPDKLILKEKNEEYLKLVLPANEFSSWDYNLYNSFNELKARISISNESINIFNNSDQKTLTVIIKSDSNLIDNKQFIETYYPSVGLTSKTKKNISYCQSSPECIGKGKIEFGTILTQKLIAIENY